MRVRRTKNSYGADIDIIGQEQPLDAGQVPARHRQRQRRQRVFIA